MMNGENGRTILLVEDEAILAMTGKNSLEKYGYEVITVGTGEKAVETVRTTAHISLILMDIDLGKGIDGTEAASIILKDHDIPVVFLSSHSEREIVAKTEKITSYGYVLKNSSITVLDASIKMAFKLFEASRKISLSELKQKTMLSNISDVIGIIGADGFIAYKSQNIEKWFGWKPEELIGTDAWLTVHPDDLERIQGVFYNLLETENSYSEVEYRYKLKDGSYKPIQLTAVNLVNDPVIHGVLINYHDISERKQVELDLREKNEALLAANKAQISEKIFNEGILECLPGYLYVYDDQGNLVRWNKKHETMTGFTGEELARKNMSDWFEGEDAVRVAAAVERVFRTGYGEVEAELLIKGGKKLLIHSNGVKLTIDGKAYFVGVGIDITERKRSEDKIREINTLLRIAGKTAKLGGWSLILESKQVLWSDEVAAIHELPAGFSPLIENAISYYAPEWRDVIIERFNDCASKGIPYDEKMEIVTAGGKRVWVRTIGEAVRNDEGKIVKVQGAFQDITDQKRTEDELQNKNEAYSALNEELRASVEELQASNEELQYSYAAIRQGEERYSALLANLEVGVVVHAADTSIIMNNARASELLGLSEDQLRGKTSIDPAWHFVSVDETPLPLSDYPVNRIVSGKKPVKGQVMGIYRGRDPSIIWMSVNAFPVFDREGAIAEILVSFMDISEQKLAEEKNRALLAEKELILKEVNHRVKNNMSSMKGLLRLQADQTDDAATAAALEDAATRMESMEILYTQLYQNTSFSELSVKAYLSPLVDAVVANYPQGSSVAVEKHIDDIILDAKRLQPLGVIVNELLTNTMKYAFADKRTGIITVSAALSAGRIIITLQDNGIGIPESVSFENSTGFGLMLVKALAAQLKGSIRIERTGGTRVVLEFDR